MRIYLKLSIPKEAIPFNYQPFFTGAIHKWIGPKNSAHGALSLFSFSWMQNISVIEKKGIKVTPDSYFFISAHDEELIRSIVKGISDQPGVCFGMNVTEIHMMEDPAFSNTQTFMTASPIFIKRRFENNEKHITFDHPSSDIFLTETLKKKLLSAHLSDKDVSVSFDRDFLNPRTKIIKYKDISNKVNVCPVIIKGTQEQIAFAWNVGVGNSTGIGFGALK
jgi:CRISPR-associated endoribonuclease Cas6